VQGLLGVGVKDAEDLVSNALGAACGVVAGSVVLRFALGGTNRWSNTRRTVTAMAVLAAAATAWVGLAYGAEGRQDRLVSAVEERFANRTLAQIQQELESDIESVWTIGGVRTSGGSVKETTARIRYPASFFSVHRCVFAVWSGDQWRVERAAGNACTEFLE
jgi:hypothetical protein